MDDAEVRTRPILIAAVAAVLALLFAAGTAFWLLSRWQVPAGGERNDKALISNIPEPRLQTAPQLERAGGTAAPEIEQHLGAQVPHSLNLRDERGTRVDWDALAARGRPIVLLPAYYRCRNLCGTVAHGALEALADTGLPPDAWQLLVFSVDPQDTPADARVLKAAYSDYAAWARPAVFTGTAPVTLSLLTGSAADTRALAHTIGFTWLADAAAQDPADPQFAHATGMVVLTPDGAVSKYLLGVRFEPTDLRSAIVEASRGRVGTLADRLLLACSHLDPRLGTHDGQVLMLVRAVGLLVLAALGISLGIWMWRQRAGRARARP